MKIFVASILLLFNIFISTGCVGTAAFGSKGEVLDKIAIQNISYVSLMPVSIKGLSENAKEIINSDSLIYILRKDILAKSIFKIFPSNESSDKNIDINNDDKMKKEFLESGAFLFANIEYYSAQFGDINATMTLKLVNPRTEQVIAYSSHDTNIGNSYFLPPSIKVITKDAIEGALNKMAKIIKN